MAKTIAFSLLALILSSRLASANLRFYTPLDHANRFGERFYPGETLRGKEYFDDMHAAGKNIACGAALWAYRNNGLSKVFHNGNFAEGLVKFELLPNRPVDIRKGMFSDDMPQTVHGVASFNTGRGAADPKHLQPDVTGMTIALNVNGRLVVITTTASVGAFASTLLGFSHLSSYSAIGSTILGGLDSEKLRSNLEALQRGETADSPNRYVSSPGAKSTLVGLGEQLGQGAFLVRHPIAGLGTLVPAVLSGRRSPFLGYKDVGYGTGNFFLLDEDEPFEERTAFRLGFELADTPFNRTIRAWIPGRWETLLRATLEGDHKYLATEFEKWNREGDIEYDVYMTIDDKRPKRSMVEHPHRKSKGEKIYVGKLTWLKRKDLRLFDYGLYQPDTQFFPDLHSILARNHLNPGFTMHLLLGGLGYGRAAGPVVGTDLWASGETPGTYWESAMLRKAVGLSATGIDQGEVDEALRKITDLHRRYALPNGIPLGQLFPPK